ncbi:hypothetical protein AB0K47_01165 [Streptomyces tirandamycinicus]|uniref:hypothetical protein n=1 Tax=Streptomyces tirandamycinicus TaxID=2174846 RepID=UPI00342EE0D8
MAPEMERPQDPADLYYACGDDIVSARPTLTGDVFDSVAVPDTDGSIRQITVMVLDHPCSLRVDGVNLAQRLTVAEVLPVQGTQWNGSFNRMFLPEPYPQAEGRAKPCAAFFDACYHVSPEQLDDGTRIACLSHFGINLLLQRRVHHFSRVVVPTFQFQEANAGVYEEADLIEEWCTEREDDEVKHLEATAECVDWLRESVPDGRRRQQLLHEPQHRSTVRKEMRARLKALKQQGR